MSDGWDPRPVFGGGAENRAPEDDHRDPGPAEAGRIPEPQPLGPEGDGEEMTDVSELLGEIHRKQK